MQYSKFKTVDREISLLGLGLIMNEAAACFGK